jgi:small subunit ribosomal protein S2
MAPFIFTKRGNIHIIDVKKTLEGLLIAKRLLAEVVSSGKDVVFVGTKRQAQKVVETVAEKCGMHYVSQRWLGGMLTNFRTIRSRLQRLQQLEAMQGDGSLESESKKQASRLKREMRKIKSNLEGVREMTRLPGAVVVVDARKEYLALREARKLGIATIGLIDTDSDPDTVDVAIPANDDSIRAINLILNELADAVAIGKTMVSARREPRQRPKRVRSRRQALARAAEEGAEAATAVETEPVKTAEPTPAETAEPTEAAEPALQEGETEQVEPKRRPKRVRSRRSVSARAGKEKLEAATAIEAEPVKSEKPASAGPASQEGETEQAEPKQS